MRLIARRASARQVGGTCTRVGHADSGLRCRGQKRRPHQVAEKIALMRWCLPRFPRILLLISSSPCVDQAQPPKYQKLAPRRFSSNVALSSSRFALRQLTPTARILDTYATPSVIEPHLRVCDL